MNCDLDRAGGPACAKVLGQHGGVFRGETSVVVRRR